MGTQRHQKRTESKPADRKFAKKIKAVAKKTGKTLGALLTSGLIITSFSAKAPAQNGQASSPKKLPDKQVDLQIAARGDELPANTYVVPKTDGGEKAKKDPKKAEKLELVPSTMTPDIGQKTITINTYTLADYKGKISPADGNPFSVWLNPEQWKDLGVASFDGKEIEVILKNNGKYVHYFLNEKWNGILEVKEPLITDRGGCGNVEIHVLTPNSPFIKPLIFWSDSRSLLIIEEHGVYGEVLGFEGGDINFTKDLLIEKMEGVRFSIGSKKTPNDVLIITVSNSERYIEFALDNNKQMTGEGRVIDPKGE